MNRSYGNLPIAWYNSPSIVFNRRTSGWMPPEHSTLMGRNQIVQVDKAGNFVREMSNDFPPAQMAVWETPHGLYPPGVVPGPPFPPGLGGGFEEGGLSGPLDFAKGLMAKWYDWVSGMSTLGKVVYWLAIATLGVVVLGKTAIGRSLKMAKWPVVGKLAGMVRKNPLVSGKWVGVKKKKAGTPWSGQYGRSYQARWAKAGGAYWKRHGSHKGRTATKAGAKYRARHNRRKGKR